jgi:hypothetical protein
MLVAAPLYLVFRDLRGTLISLGTLIATSLFLKKLWYDNLVAGEGHTDASDSALAAAAQDAESAGG